MLKGLNSLELGRLRMSVGYGTHKKGRLLSPIEVGKKIKRAIDAGSTHEQCATEIQIDISNIKRFLNILEKIPSDLHHLINWGRSRGSVGFSCAYELAKIPSHDAQRAVVNAVQINKLSKKEVQQVAQLKRSAKSSIEECLKEVIGMRTTIDRSYVFIGTINDIGIQKTLTSFTQRERDAMLATGLEKIGLTGATGNLGPIFFTLVGDEIFGKSMKNFGKKNIEKSVCTYIAECINSD